LRQSHNFWTSFLRIFPCIRNYYDDIFWHSLLFETPHYTHVGIPLKLFPPQWIPNDVTSFRNGKAASQLLPCLVLFSPFFLETCEYRHPRSQFSPSNTNAMAWLVIMFPIPDIIWDLADSLQIFHLSVNRQKPFRIKRNSASHTPCLSPTFCNWFFVTMSSEKERIESPFPPIMVSENTYLPHHRGQQNNPRDTRYLNTGKSLAVHPPQPFCQIPVLMPPLF
jgi:hypothetical protein